MKKAFLLVFCILFMNIAFSQNHHAIKAGISFAKVTGNIPEYSQISSRICPQISWMFRTMGDHWGYFLELGYSQSGFNEKIDRYYYNSYHNLLHDYQENSLVVHNLDLIPAGLQYAFLSDWSKVRPIIQTSFTLRFSMTYTVKTLETSESEMPSKPFSLLYSAGAGIMFTRHSTFTVSYGLGLLDILNPNSGLKDSQIQLAACYFF